MKKLPLLCAGLAFVAFLLGLLHLFKLRFDAGDSYPPYSSFRTDPLGAKALLDSIDTLRPARRSLQPLTKLGDGRDTTLLWLGESVDDLKFEPREFEALETFVRSGGRLVVAMVPVFAPSPTNLFAARAAARGAAGRKGATNAPPPSRSSRRQRPAFVDDPRTERLTSNWGFRVRFRNLSKSEAGEYKHDTANLQEAPAGSILPSAIKVWTALGFDQPDLAWRVLYSRGSESNALGVLMERNLGRGSVVLCADSYYFSNEALRDDRQAGLLAWLAGSGRQVVFEETHLGVSENPGIATLARKYGLQTLFGSVLLLAVLFIWKNAVGFMPPYDQQLAADQGEFVAGRDSGAGFVNLLRRHIAPGQLLRVCLEQWNAHVARTRKPSPDKLHAMQRLIDAQNSVDPRHRDPVGTYREFSRILSRKPGNRR